MCILRREDLANIERDNPSLKGQIRELALDRARRFKLPLDRITLTVEQQHRRYALKVFATASTLPQATCWFES